MSKVTLQEFVLTESFEPVAVPFGADFNMKNGRWDSIAGFDYTFFTANGLYYSVIIKKTSGIVAFGVSDEKLNDPSMYSDDRYAAKNVIRVFNNVIYIVLQGAQKLGYKTLKFFGKDAGLGRMYDAMVENKYLIDKLARYGWTYEGKDSSGYYSFTR